MKPSPGAKTYLDFLCSKIEIAKETGFEVTDSDVSSVLKPHQRAMVRWMVRGGQRACFAAFGLGKTVIQLETVRLTRERAGGMGLIVIPLGVRQEFIRDAAMLTITVSGRPVPGGAKGEEMNILAIDPGTRHTGIAYGPVEKLRMFPAQKISLMTIHTVDEGLMFMALLGLIRQTDIIAIEDYEYRPYVRRRVNQSVAMGKMIAALKAAAEARDKRTVVIPAAKAKANMDCVREFLGGNDHERSAMCVALAAWGILNLERMEKR